MREDARAGEDIGESGAGAPPAADAATAGTSRDPRLHLAARIVLVLVLVGFGLYILSDFLKALAWAVVLGIALGPLFRRARRRFGADRHGIVLPLVFTAAVALALLLPLAALAVEAVAEARSLLEYARQAEQSGIPVPEFIDRLPFGAAQAGAWWNAHLAHAGWAQEILQRLDTSSNLDLGRQIGADVVHRAVLLGFALLALFFIFRDGDALVAECQVAGGKLFGPRGERVARQMAASVHGTVDGLVLVGLGEGVVIGFVYWLAGVPHPILFGAITAVAAMIPFAAVAAVGLAGLLLLFSGSVEAALATVAAGFLVIFVADHFVRPALIGGTTKLPFLWVLLGILGGVEGFGLLGLFIGPAVMAALILLWREFTEAEGRPADAGPFSPSA